ncbi:unnamed protein product, partial [Brassica oleracea]
HINNNVTNYFTSFLRRTVRISKVTITSLIQSKLYLHTLRWIYNACSPTSKIIWNGKQFTFRRKP